MAFKNFSYSTVATAPSPATSGTTLTVAAGTGSRFPAVPFKATVWAIGSIPVPTNAEIVNVTARVGDVLTIERASESTVARTIIVGDQIAATLTKGVLDSLEARIAALEAGEGTTVQNIRKVDVTGAFSNLQVRDFTITPSLDEFANAVIVFMSGGVVNQDLSPKITSNTNLEVTNTLDASVTADLVVHIVEYNVEP